MDTSVVSQRERTHINDLPFEVLEQIFLLCKGYLFSVMDPRFTPMVLTYVCRLWRNICNAAPPLWASFTTLPAEKVYSLPPAIVDRWLVRARNSPLQIDIGRPCETMLHTQAPLADSIRASLVVRAAQWEALSFSTMIDENFMEDFLSLPPNATPSLKVFSILSQVPEPTLAPYIPRLVRKLQRLSSLKQLHLNLAGYFELGQLEGLPFERLTHVDLRGGWRIDDFTNVLSRCTSAIEISIAMNLFYSDMEPVMRSDIVLSTLKSLTISTNNPLGLAAHLRSFTCPSLRRLHIRIEDRARATDTTTAIPLLHDFMAKSPLEQLVMCIGAVNWDGSDHFLKSEGVKRIPEVELRLQNQTKGINRRDCPFPGCKDPHLGWTARSHQHLGTPLPVVDWQPSFWSVHFPSEIREWYSTDRMLLWMREEMQRIRKLQSART